MNYQNTKIYKIESTKGDKIYIGSTTKQYLSQRMDTHRKDYKKWKNGNNKRITSYELFDEYGVENCSIILLETFPCNSKDEAHAREAYYIRSLVCVNKVIPDRTPKEYKKDYYIANKEAIQKQKSIVYTCSCGKLGTNHHKAQHERSKFHQAFLLTISNQ